MIRTKSPSYDQLHINATELLANYKKEQIRYDESRYLPMLRPATKNICHEQWAEFVGGVAVSLQSFQPSSMDHSMKKQCASVLEACFSFVLKRLNDANEQVSSLSICCLKALDTNLENLPTVLKNDDYDVLYKHVEWLSSIKDSGQLHKGMTNQELAKQIRRNSKKDEFVFVATPQKQAVLHV